MNKVQLPLRPYQQECLAAISAAQANGQYRQLVALPTGAGKTVVFAELLRRSGRRSLVIAHTNELLEQARDKISMMAPGLEVGVVNGHNKQYTAHIVISSIQSASRSETVAHLIAQNFDVIIVDEAHHCGANTYRQLLKKLGFDEGSRKLLVGFSATPFRSDGKGLGEIFDVVVYERNIKEMIDEGYLCRPKGIRVATDLDLSKVLTADGDFQTSSLARVMDTPPMISAVVDTFLQQANDRQAICFAVTIAHAQHLSNAFNASGIHSAILHGGMPAFERTAVLERYRSHEVQVLCNCQILTEGFDAPETSCVIVARPTRSTGLYQQCVGRGLRLWPNKSECIVLDFGDRSHILCSVTTLLKDAESTSYDSNVKDGEKQETASRLPPQLNQKLKKVILNFDPLGDAFSWKRDEQGIYFIRGSEKTRLKIIPQGDSGHAVIMTKPYERITIASGLTFEYAFATAEGYAKTNRKLFIVSDTQADWRNLPITDRQIAYIRKRGYRAGIKKLSRGQATVLISSGVL